MRVSVCSMAMLGLAACSARPTVQGDGAGDGGSTSAGATSVATDSGPPNTSGPPPTVTTTVDPDGGTAESTSVGFIMEGDYTPPPIECDIHAQDCDRGFKCVPVRTQGSGYDGALCVPVVDDPQGIDDPCLLDDPATGVDDCGGGQFCWQTDEMGVGTCIGLCLLENPDDEWYYCEDPQAQPEIGCQECFCICIRPCDPIAQDCGEGQGCYPVSDDWECAPDASEGAAQDAACDYINACAAGYACLYPDSVPSCDPGSKLGCCTAVCDTSLPDTCPGQELGMSCLAWYERGAAPPGYETVGVCAVWP